MNNPSAFPLGEPNDGFAQYFDGQSWLAPVLDAPEVSIHNVTFEPGCRNHWHIHHHAAQILIAVGGRGYYQLEGEEPKELGAAPHEAFSHLAFMIADGTGDATNEWLEPVDPDAYGTLR